MLHEHLYVLVADDTVGREARMYLIACYLSLEVEERNKIYYYDVDVK
jgi:hypothetical protein